MTSSLNWAGRLTLIALFFSWGTMSVLIDVSIPYFKSAFELGYRDALLIQSSFFLAYLFLARLAGQIISRLGFRKGVFTGLSLMAIGAGALALATIFEEFLALLPSVFIIASGITFFQVSANPLAATMGLTKSPASNLTLAQGFNSLGTVTNPEKATELRTMVEGWLTGIDAAEPSLTRGGNKKKAGSTKNNAKREARRAARKANRKKKNQ